MPSKKAKKEAVLLEAALGRAQDDARRTFNLHEADRAATEVADKAVHDAAQLERLRERERLHAEADAFEAVRGELAEARRLALDEDDKHRRWRRLTEASWLPDVRSEADISAFLGAWEQEQVETLGQMDDDTVVDIHLVKQSVALTAERGWAVDSMHLSRTDTPLSAAFRRRRLEEDLRMATLAVELAERVACERDEALMLGDEATAEWHRANLRRVMDTTMGAMDRLTCGAVGYVDFFFDDEIFARHAPQGDEDDPLIRFGLYIKGKARNYVAHIHYTDIGINVDPKDATVNNKLPGALQLQKFDNIAIRAMQFRFDPCAAAAPPGRGRRLFALDCAIALESVTVPERAKKVADWTCRAGSEQAHTLHRNEYPPRQDPDAPAPTMAQLDELSLKVTAQAPRNVVLRSRNPQMGRWNAERQQWEPCGAATIHLDASLQFVTSHLSLMAVVQEKGFDVPYHQWWLQPVAEDEVRFVVDPRRQKAGEVEKHHVLRFAVRDRDARLEAPNLPQLAHLLRRWMAPATLLRLLAGAGFNLLLCDEDAEHFDPAVTGVVLPKTRALEEKGYRDLARLCTARAFCSTRHSKEGEDPDCALFRMAAEERPFDADPPPEHEDPPLQVEGRWLPVRYETTRCALAGWREGEDVPTVSNAPGQATHLNLFALLAAELGEERVKHRALASSALLQEGVFNMLTLTRPFSWG